MKVLIVEDEPKTAEYLQKGLGEQGCAVGKTDDLIAARRQDHGKRVANGGIVVDYENLPAGEGLLSHVSSSMHGET